MKCAMIFPGYGNQFVGMGKELYDTSRVIQEHFEEAAHCLDINFVQVCFASSEQELQRPEYAYPALFLLGSACSALLQERSVVVDIYSGFDVGVYTAMHAAQAFSFADGLYTLHKLAPAYQECLATTDMLAFRVTGLDEATVHSLCQASSTQDQWVTIGAYENDTTFIIVGHHHIAEDLRVHMHSMRGVKTKIYPLEAGVYAPICDDIVTQYKPYLQKIDYHEPLYTVIGSDMQLIDTRDDVRNTILYQMFKPAYYDRVIQYLATYDAIIVPMPAKKLVEYVQSQVENTPIYTVTNMDDLDMLEKKIIHRHKEE